jgi:cobalt-zinc-cadmium efflux system protein
MPDPVCNGFLAESAHALSHEFNIDHATLQIEHPDGHCEAHEVTI